MIKVSWKVVVGDDLDCLCAIVGLKRKVGETDIELRKRFVSRKGIVNNLKYSLDNIYS